LIEIPVSYEYNQEAKMSERDSSNQIQNNLTERKELKSYLRTKIGFRRQHGFQPELVCLLMWSQRLPIVNCISINTKNNTYEYFILYWIIFLIEIF
jgi:hypothetical protein